jgi:PrtD family type I secretion system ABC transporter
MQSPLTNALAACRRGLIGVGLFSGVSNLLMLTGPIFMLEIYDRILPSRSIPTLVVIAALTLVLFSAQGLLDYIRGRLLTRIGLYLDDRLSRDVFKLIVDLPLKAGPKAEEMQPQRDLDAVRSFLSGAGPAAFFDLVWIPLYLATIFLLHVWLGVTALVGAAVVVSLTLLTEGLIRAPTKAATATAVARNKLGEAARRNAEVVRALGMRERLASQWSKVNQDHLQSHRAANDAAGGFGALSRVLRLSLQSAMLAVGAYLVIQQEATGGVIIAGSILSSRALAPVDAAIANWRSFIAARQSWQRLTKLLPVLGDRNEPMQLPVPAARLSVEAATIASPGGGKVVVQDITFSLNKGDALAVIGPSASGKSSLARALVGIWAPMRGKVRLDGAALDQWAPDALGRHIGYLPQDVELFAGTVAQNIARFEPEADSEAIVAAARAAGVHDLIVGLSDGYETEIGEQGAVLSAGQRQRIALARALYSSPFLIVLDEPNSNLDAEGEAALGLAIRGIKQRGGIAVLVAHRPSALSAVDLVLALHQGRQHAFGPRDEVLRKVLRPDGAAAQALKVVSEGGRIGG